jgi:hypothetical protein
MTDLTFNRSVCCIVTAGVYCIVITSIVYCDFTLNSCAVNGLMWLVNHEEKVAYSRTTVCNSATIVKHFGLERMDVIRGFWLDVLG